MKNLLLILSVATCFMASAVNAGETPGDDGGDSQFTWWNTDKSPSSQFVNEGDLQDYEGGGEITFW